jgi:hypothetical protein
MHRGYVKLWRKTADTGLSCVLLGLWAHCLLEAAYATRTVYVAGQRVELTPGQFVFGRSAWVRALGLTEKVLRNAVASLTTRAMIRAVARASRFTVYEIMNWSRYQQQEDDAGPADGLARGLAKGSRRADAGPHLKNVKKEEKTSISPPPPPWGEASSSPAPAFWEHGQPGCARDTTEKTTEKAADGPRPAKAAQHPPEFEEIWQAVHPLMRNCGKIAAEAAWAKARKRGMLPPQQDLLRALATYREAKERQTDPKVAHLSTWLNQGRWDTGDHIEGRTAAQRRAEHEATVRQAAETEGRKARLDAAWLEVWDRLAEDIKAKWRAHIETTSPVLAQARERGQPLEQLVESFARAAWRKHRETKIQAAKAKPGAAASTKASAGPGPKAAHAAD